MTTKRSSLLLSFLLFACCSVSFAQKITGKITNEKGLPLEFASVLLIKDSTVIKPAATDTLGNYRFSNVPASNYIIKVSRVGYITTSKTFYAGGDLIVDFRLITDSNTLSVATVVAKKPLIERKIDRLIFNIDGNVNFTGLDAMDALMRAPLLDVRDNSIKRIGGMVMGVMIDGRLQSYMDPATIANKLRSIPAESILRIEIITNPGTEYDAEGVGGLVNIVLKKIKKLGYSGNITIGYTRINQDDLYRFSIDFNYNIKKLRTFFSFGTSTGRALTTNNITIYYPAFTWNSKGHRYEYQEPYFTSIGFEYDLSKKSSFGISFNPMFSYPDQTAFQSVSVSNPATNQADSAIYNNSASDINYKNYSVNLHFTHAFDSTVGQLTVDADWVKNRFSKDIENNSETYNTSGTLVPGSRFRYLSYNADQPEIMTLNAVIKKPTSKYTLTYGAKFTFIKSSQSIYQYKTSFDPVVTETLTDNVFNANQNIQAVFANYQRSIKKFEFKAGLRAESTQLDWNIPSSPLKDNKSYFNIFPSVDMGYQLNDKNSFTLSFNRRFSRPGFSTLNPTLIFANTYRFYQGNPDLNPYFTNNLELSYTYGPSLTFSLGHSAARHAIYNVSVFKNNSNVVVDNYYNYINSAYYSFDCFYAIEKIKNLQSNVEVTVYYNTTSSSLPQTASNFSRWSGSFRTSNTYFFNKKRTLVGGLIFNYQLADLSGISISKERYYLDISLRYSLFNRKLDISFAGRDIFKTNNFVSSSVVNGILEEMFTNDRSRRFGLTVRYNFGNNKIRKGSQYNGVGGDQSIISK